MDASDSARIAIELEQRIIRHRESYESAEMLAQHVRREAFHAIRTREELEARHQQGTQALTTTQIVFFSIQSTLSPRYHSAYLNAVFARVILGHGSIIAVF